MCVGRGEGGYTAVYGISTTCLSLARDFTFFLLKYLEKHIIFNQISIIFSKVFKNILPFGLQAVGDAYLSDCFHLQFPGIISTSLFFETGVDVC